jgi:exosortase/archaeosortase family protein
MSLNANSLAAWLRPRWPWEARPRGLGTATRVSAALVAIAVAYHYSLASLLQTLDLETPLAYLGLVPIIALLLAATRSQASAAEPQIHDRQIDYIIGIPLMGGALAINLLLPAQLSSMFWVWRVDLLSLPIFVAGAIAIVFGARALWRMRVPVAFLLLAWPLPYTVLLIRWLEGFTNLTLAALRVVLHAVPVATAQGGSDGSLFLIHHGKESFVLSVASACSGVNSLVGFLLVGLAFLSLVRGRPVRLALWLVGGLSLLWVLNIGRILLLFAIGGAYGERVAIDGLHPFIGLVLFNVGVLAMLLGLRPFGLELRLPAGLATRPAGTARMPAPARNALAHARPRPSAVPRVWAGLTVLALVSCLLAVTNNGLKAYDLVANDLGVPRVVDFERDPGPPSGWSAHRTATYTWARRYFGEDSTWQRFAYTWKGKSSSQLRATVPVIADVITTSNLRTFSTYGIEACYRFHGYKLESTGTVDLGGGVTGNVLAYYNPKLRSDWNALYWYWPVQTPAGVRYERITLMLIGTAKATIESPAPPPGVARSITLGLREAFRGEASGDALSDRMLRSWSFMTGFARAVIEGKAAKR